VYVFQILAEAIFISFNNCS